MRLKCRWTGSSSTTFYSLCVVRQFTSASFSLKLWLRVQFLHARMQFKSNACKNCTCNHGLSDWLQRLDSYRSYRKKWVVEGMASTNWFQQHEWPRKSEKYGMLSVHLHFRHYTVVSMPRMPAGPYNIKKEFYTEMTSQLSATASGLSPSRSYHSLNFKETFSRCSHINHFKSTNKFKHFL